MRTADRGRPFQHRISYQPHAVACARVRCHAEADFAYGYATEATTGSPARSSEEVECQHQGDSADDADHQRCRLEVQTWNDYGHGITRLRQPYLAAHRISSRPNCMACIWSAKATASSRPRYRLRRRERTIPILRWRASPTAYDRQEHPNTRATCRTPRLARQESPSLPGSRSVVSCRAISDQILRGISSRHRRWPREDRHPADPPLEGPPPIPKLR